MPSYCFTYNRRKICFPLYYFVKRFKWPPRPDPPPDWVKDFGFDERLLEDLGTLGLMYDLAANLSPTLKRQFQPLLKEKLTSQQLPAGDSISL